MRAAIVAAFSLAAVASAQTQHVVTVSAFQFSPPTVTAAKGDVVTFVFSGTPGAHSVTQSSFADPCSPLTGGFDSGFVVVPASFKGPFEEFSLTVENATQPIWFYCGQTNPSSHCIFGMVGAINAPSSGNTFENFQKTAKGLSAFPSQAVHSVAITGGVGVVAASAPASGTDAAASTATAPANSAPPSSGGSPSNSSASAGSPGSSSSAGAPAASKSGEASAVNGQFTGVYGMIAAVLLGVAL